MAEARIPASVVSACLHTTPRRLVRLAQAKLHVGGALAGLNGSAGGNAHAANLVAGLFAATGQDLAQMMKN
ncbi:unnamed protein product [Protopolystoma xenopodis]|uniref:Uncharacterized protein n=1 Tax=Protopolystoma xenopodis TaxID=117903 RepID=A0A448X5R0_9PLAT|nr:unnamed protein product [Protopolystoma xenopodis]